ncbi:hypothetical protein NEUTE1DRAFT_125490 [Neurospora tetrasperma FGSC 2508]|uniref:DUF8004 domain-containing protein n=1 Tax=Neurospora tetrasperma (strain FGSC 2508 / ATCC MYA-4615 / P0657) TaxID=510951 RepID=F8N4C9_NEUT8|nr:uncharacterized protein NEUTE1DRAFT_125490 [Neurospora tetrasperma FGSC 2508]EGO51872.1 hypothetical protein NEUTE1DRAFT_125490 [Neurospora tetrasperma FGSC 2508]
MPSLDPHGTLVSRAEPLSLKGEIVKHSRVHGSDEAASVSKDPETCEATMGILKDPKRKKPRETRRHGGTLADETLKADRAPLEQLDMLVVLKQIRVGILCVRRKLSCSCHRSHLLQHVKPYRTDPAMLSSCLEANPPNSDSPETPKPDQRLRSTNISYHPIHFEPHCGSRALFFPRVKMGSRTFDPPVYAVPPPQYYYRTPVSPVLPDMAPTSVDAGSVRRKPLHRMSTLSQHLSSSLRHNTSSGREKGIQEPSVVQLPPTPDSETTTSKATSPDTDRESGIQDVDQGPPASKIQRRKSRLSMLIPSFFFSPDAADQQGTGLKGTTGARKQQRPVTASPAPAANYANPEAQQAASVSDVHNKNMVIYHNPAANYSSPDGLLLGSNNNPTTNSSSPPLSSLQSASRPSNGARSVSVEGPPPGAAIPPNRLQKQSQQQQQNQQQPPSGSSSPTSPTGSHSRGRSTSSQPSATHNRTPSAEPPRIVSTSADSRPTSTHSNGSDDGSSPTAQKHKQRRSWFGGRSGSNSAANKGDSNAAWIVAPDSKAEYSTANLLNGDKVPELWNESGNLFIYLHPPTSGRGPSFKVHDYLVSSSQLLLSEITGFTNPRKASAGGSLLTVDDAANRRPVPSPSAYGANPTDGHLYLPLENTNLDSLVAARNLFALLTSQPIIATHTYPTLFAALLQVAALLKSLGFRNHDGSTFGEQVDAAFNSFLDQFGVSDVRGSREKTIQAIILGEHMRSWTLYNEAFTHAVGKYESIQDLNLPVYKSISVSTRNRLERAYLDLTNRQANANLRLESFEFPSLFAGIGSSTSSEEAKHLNFKEWQKSFAKMRTFVLGYYKDSFGSWPPKARSKKNHFSQSGLNRQCLKMLYSDCCALYDLLVDRESITPRVIDQKFDDGVAEAEAEREKAKNAGEFEYELFLMRSALRAMLSEFDHSSPPVLPPIPFDCPKIPSMTAIHENYRALDAKKRAKLDRKLASNELLLMLIKSRNLDTDSIQLPFLQAFKEFEYKEAKGVNPSDIANQRVGYWLFLYVVLQSLPMLVVDAPQLHWTEGVEYFLCEAPQGNPPWMEDAGEVRKMWYQTNNGQGIVELSADVVMFSVEGIYMRSHCWLAAKEWEAALLPASAAAAAAINQPLEAAAAALGEEITPLEPPRPVFQDNDSFASGHQRSGSRSQSSYGGGTPGSEPASPHFRPRTGSTISRRVSSYRSSIAIGLEPLDFSQFGPNGPSSQQEAEFMQSLAPGGDRSSRVVSTPANMLSGGDGGRPDSSNSTAAHGHRASSVGSAQTLAALGNLSIGEGQGRSSAPPAAYRDPSRGSISQQVQQQQQQQQYPNPSVSPSPLGRGESPPRQSPPRQVAQPAAPAPSNGGSTFDDILKGMGGQEKKKKKGLFF